jgi:hypothetical protein
MPDEIQLVVIAIVVALGVLSATAAAIWRYWHRQTRKTRRFLFVLLGLSLVFIISGVAIQSARWTILLGLLVGPVAIGNHMLWKYLARPGRPPGLEPGPRSLDALDDRIDALGSHVSIWRAEDEEIQGGRERAPREDDPEA